tara:strand:+ start:14 stop:169 length:156 start_codon:yes stop_codon:yes gene_type:complete
VDQQDLQDQLVLLDWIYLLLHQVVLLLEIFGGIVMMEICMFIIMMVIVVNG